MMKREGITWWQIVLIVVACVVVGIFGLSVALVPVLQRANELTNRTVCMSNLSSIGKALTLYKGMNNNEWPWIPHVRSDWSKVPTGANRDKDPFDDPNDVGDRSITSLAFLLVRDNQPVKLFICPSTDDQPDSALMHDSGGGMEFYWDFSGASNCSYSWQAPVKAEDGTFRQGLNDNDNETAVIADRTPAASDPLWQPDDVSQLKPGKAMAPNMSRNHAGEQVNVLFVAMNVRKFDQPLVQYRPNLFDNIYTASNQKRRGSASSTSLDIAEHLSTRDTFLLGPVAK